MTSTTSRRQLPLNDLWERGTRRLRKARTLPPGVRLAHATEPIFRRVPVPFVARLAHQLELPIGEMVTHFRSARHGDIAQHLSTADANLVASGQIGMVPGAALYAIVRTIRPEIMVETGVASGASSAFILAAMRDNEHGRLISIDLPFTIVDDAPAAIIEGTSIDRGQWSPIPPGKPHGWLVPDELRDRWDLRAGDARDLLPSALEEAGTIDIFLHDSLHTLEHMLFEFETAWPRIRPGGILSTDDLGRKHVDPLQRFARSIGLPFAVLGGMGFIRKASG